MLEWVAGLTFVFKPVLEELAQTSAADYAKDFCKDSLKHVLGERDEWKQATLKATSAFLQEFEQELISAGQGDDSIKEYAKPLAALTRATTFKTLLGGTIIDSASVLQGYDLAKAWKDCGLVPVPPDFDWQKLSRRVQNKARKILREDARLRELLNSQAIQCLVDLTHQIAPISPGFDLAKYSKSLLARFGYLKLESLDPNPDHWRIALQKIFVEQNVKLCQDFNPRTYELPKDYIQRLNQGESIPTLTDGELRRLRKAYLSESAKPVLELIGDPNTPLLVLLGDPGSGKSTLLQYLAIEWASSTLADLPSKTLPLFIELNAYADAFAKERVDFLEFMHEGSASVGQLDKREIERRLHAGSATLLLDGLDEIFDPGLRRDILSQITNIAVRYPKARIILTSRVIGYRHDFLRNAGFQHYMLQDLDDVQIETFVRRWHMQSYEVSSERQLRSHRLRTSIESHVAIRELARNPLLLTLMALLNRHQELPRDRCELYNQASRLLLQQWDASRALRDDPLLADKSFDYKDKQAMLRDIALKMQTAKNGLATNVITADELETTLISYLMQNGYADPRPIARRIISRLRERNFILCLLGPDLYAFVHRTFLEFFCASAFVWKFEKERSLTLAELKRKTFDAHWNDDRWHEVLRLITGELEPGFAGKLVESQLKGKHGRHEADRLFLAAKCFGEIRNRKAIEPLSRNLKSRLLRLVRRNMRTSFFDDDDEDEDGVFQAERALSGEGQEGVGPRAVRAYAACWPASEETKVCLWKFFHTANTMSVRCACLQELARGWRHDRDLHCQLRSIGEADNDPQIRETLIRELARDTYELEETIMAWLKTRGREDGSFFVREVAAQELLKRWKFEPSVVFWLKERSQFYQGARLLFKAVRHLAQDEKDIPETLNWLKQLSITESDWLVRWAVTVALQPTSIDTLFSDVYLSSSVTLTLPA